MKKSKYKGIQALLALYILHDCPSRIDFNPTVIEVKDNRVYFGMRKHYGVLCISKSKIMKRLICLN